MEDNNKQLRFDDIEKEKAVEWEDWVNSEWKKFMEDECP